MRRTLPNPWTILAVTSTLITVGCSTTSHNAPLTVCDPLGQGLDRQLNIYNTPVVVNDQLNRTARVLPYHEREEVYSVSQGRTANYYFVRWYTDGSGNRACQVRSEESYSPALPSPFDGSTTSEPFEGVGGSPTLIVEGPRRFIQFATLRGSIVRYEMASNGWPLASGSHFSVKTTSTVHGGPDSSAYIDPDRDLMIFGNKCFPGKPCEGDHGRLQLHTASDASGAIEDSHDLKAWVFGSPVGLSDSAGPGDNQVLFAIGTWASQNSGFPPTPLSSDYDCDLLTFFAGPGGQLTLADRLMYGEAWDVPCDTDLADGFGKEPVPFGNDDILALQYFGKFWVTEVLPSTGAIRKRYHVIWDDEAGSQFRHPPEMSPVIGTDPLSGRKIAMWGIQQSGASTPALPLASLYVAVDLDAVCPKPPRFERHCTVNPNDHLIDAIPVSTVSRPLAPAAWAPGTAAVYRHRLTGERRLAFVVAHGAVGHLDPNRCSPACGTGDIPPTLHIYSWSGSHWDDHSVALTTDGSCYQDDDGDLEYADPIEVVSGVVIYDSAVYAATGDGLFWEYDTAVPSKLDPFGWVLEGYSEPWPRYRETNAGSASLYR